MHILIALLTLAAHAELDPLTGARVSMVGIQKLLAAPFLPNLEERHPRFGVQASYMTAKLGGQPENYDRYLGKFNGLSGGFGYSPKLKEGYGYFVNGMVMRMNGDVRVQGITQASSFSTTGVVALAGASARLIGREDGAFLFGVFAGPSLMHISSSLGLGEGAVTSQPNLIGVTAGAQARLKFRKVMANPCVLTSQNVYGACVRINAPGGIDVPKGCSGTSNSIALRPSFTAFGLVVGYGDFALNIMSQLINDVELVDVAAQNYAISYSF